MVIMSLFLGRWLLVITYYLAGTLSCHCVDDCREETGNASTEKPGVYERSLHEEPAPRKRVPHQSSALHRGDPGMRLGIIYIFVNVY